MAVFVWRTIFKVRSGKMDESVEILRKFDAVQRQLGWPPQRAYRLAFGGHDGNTLITETEWDSLAVLEEAATKAGQSPEHRALSEEDVSLFESLQRELYVLVE